MMVADDSSLRPPYEEEPETIAAIDRELESENVAPQWEPSADDLDAWSAGPDGPGQLPRLRTEELEIIRAAEEVITSDLSEHDRELLQRSVQSIDYLGDWADPGHAKDSIILCCEAPGVHEGQSGPEYTCRYDEFTAARHALHRRIVKRMLTSARTFCSPSDATVADELPSRRPAPSAAAAPSADAVAMSDAAEAAGAAVEQRSPPRGSAPSPREQHVFLVVGVPGSGKDTVIKRYLRCLELRLLDASADIVKEYLAAWGADDLSVEVRAHNAAHGPGKHLLHSQYLHRESILVCDQLVEQALQRQMSIVLEKTLFDIAHILSYARQFRDRGCRVHLFGTYITPLKNWDFLCNRMRSGQTFGRYITKAQTVEALRQYHANLGSILDDAAMRAVFDSIHVYDVVEGEWCVSIADDV